MKTIISSFIILLAAMSASAVSVSWGASGSKAAMKGLTSGSALSTGTDSETANLRVYYMLYSDYNTVKGLGLVTADALADYVLATANGQTSSSSGAAGRVAASSSINTYENSGVSYFARVYTKFDGKDYFMDVFAGTGSDGEWITTQSGGANVQEKLAWAEGTYGGATATAVGTKNAWVAVPEPATGALALAGVALLFRRRRA